MRLSEWRSAAPGRDTAGPKVVAVVQPILAMFALGTDPSCWVAWGDDPQVRWTLLAPSAAGLVTIHVRVNVPGEGPRASAKLTRWNRVSVGELAAETQGGHRVVTFQVENIVLRGADAEADGIAAFAIRIFAAIDGRPLPDEPSARAATKRGSAPTGGAAGPARRTTTRRTGA